MRLQPTMMPRSRSPTGFTTCSVSIPSLMILRATRRLERQKMLRPGAGTADPGEAAPRVGAIQILFDNSLDDRPKIPVFPLESALILGDKPLEMMEQYPVEDGPLRMTRTIDSRHIGKDEARIGPGSGSRFKVQNRQELQVVALHILVVFPGSHAEPSQSSFCKINN